MPESMDAITLLRDDHRSVAQLFKQFESAGDNAHVEKRRIVDQIIEALSVHAAIEEQVFYPVARAAVDGVEDIVLESLEEHHIVKWTLSELDGLDPSEERFDAKVTVLIESVRHHVKEEETEFFPKVRAAMSKAALNDLGDALVSAKASAPTHPHPRASDTPPANAVASAISGVMDRVGDNVSGVAQGSVSVVQDLIARITGSSKPKASSPTGSSTTRQRATGVRNGAKSATDTVTNTARSVKTGVESTARAAKSGVKATTTTAKKSVRATATTAKRASTTTGRTAKKAATKTRSAAKRSAPRTKKAAATRSS
jgi:hemerythrin-like domain-containing protein